MVTREAGNKPTREGPGTCAVTGFRQDGGKDTPGPPSRGPVLTCTAV